MLKNQLDGSCRYGFLFVVSTDMLCSSPSLSLFLSLPFLLSLSAHASRFINMMAHQICVWLIGSCFVCSNRSPNSISPNWLNIKACNTLCQGGIIIKSRRVHYAFQLVSPSPGECTKYTLPSASLIRLLETGEFISELISVIIGPTNSKLGLKKLQAVMHNKQFPNLSFACLLWHIFL